MKEKLRHISIDGDEVLYMDLVDTCRFDLCNKIDSMFDELCDMHTDEERAVGVECGSDYGTIRVWEE